jgi:hypothetical protein
VLEEVLQGVMLPRLASQPMTRQALQAEQARVKALYERTPSDPVAELDGVVLSMLQGTTYRHSPELRYPLRAFGQELPLNLQNVWDEWRLGPLLSPWLEKRGRLDLSSYQALRTSAVDKFSDTQDWNKLTKLEQCVYSSADDVLSLVLRPSLQTAQVILALRLHKAENGAYPASLQSLAPRLPGDFPLDSWDYEVVDGHAVIQRDQDRISSKQVPSWTLL